MTYSKRYPTNFEYFEPAEYKGTDLQRRINSSYDNATLYNDFVVSEIIKIAKELDAVVIYFSDHGQDLFAVNPEYYGHAITEIPASLAAATQVPLMFYVSPSYNERNPVLLTELREAQHADINTRDIIYTVMDILGVHFKNDDRVQQKSVLNHH